MSQPHEMTTNEILELIKTLGQEAYKGRQTVDQQEIGCCHYQASNGHLFHETATRERCNSLKGYLVPGDCPPGKK